MTAVTFDTLRFANRLKEAGVPDKQAEVMAEMQKELFANNLNDLVTREDLNRGLKELRLEISAEHAKIYGEIAKVHGEMATLRWGMAVTVGGIVALIVKSFFPH